MNWLCESFCQFQNLPYLSPDTYRYWDLRNVLKYGLKNSMLEESWIPSLCLCDIDFLPPSSLGFKNHSLKCKCFSPEGKKGSIWKLGQREVSQIFSTDIRNYKVSGSMCLSVCPYICMLQIGGIFLPLDGITKFNL